MGNLHHSLVADQGSDACFLKGRAHITFGDFTLHLRLDGFGEVVRAAALWHRGKEGVGAELYVVEVGG